MPISFELEALKAQAVALPGIADIEVLRVWSMDNEHHTAEAVLSTTLATWSEVEALKESLRTLLAQYGIVQSVIEVKQETANS